ncbi:hypothetical protein GQ457_10G017980 [Hibiscus cannabinus]
MSRRSSGTMLRVCLVIFAVVSALGVCGHALYWRFNKTLKSVDSKLSCSPCICDCPPPLSLLKIAPGLANLSITDCGSNDPDLKQEMEKQFVDLLTEELKLQEAIAEEHAHHMNITFGEAKRVASQYQREAEKCIAATETCEGARERAEALLIKERKNPKSPPTHLDIYRSRQAKLLDPLSSVVRENCPSISPHPSSICGCLDSLSTVFSPSSAVVSCRSDDQIRRAKTPTCSSRCPISRYQIENVRWPSDRHENRFDGSTSSPSICKSDRQMTLIPRYVAPVAMMLSLTVGISHQVLRSATDDGEKTTDPSKSKTERDVKSSTRLGFRSGHFRSDKIGYRSFQVDLTFRLESGQVQVRFRSGPFQVGSVSGRVHFRSGSFQVGLFQVGSEADNWQVNSGSGRLQVGFISGRVHFRSVSFQVGSILGRFHFRSGNFRSISFNVGLIGFRICIKFETLSLVQILDRRCRCLVGWVGIVHRWLLGHFE